MKLLKQLSLYTLVGVFGAGVNFFVMPVLSHYLLPADYGLLSLFNTYITILMPLVSISAYNLLSVDYFKQKSPQTFGSQFTSIQIIPLVTTVFLLLLTWASFDRFAPLLELQGMSRIWGYIMLVITLLSIYFEQFLAFLVIQKKAVAYAGYVIAKVCIEVSLTFYFIIVRHMGWEGRMYSWIITSTIYFILGMIYFSRQGFVRGPIRWQYIREGIVFGSPLILHGIGKFVVNQSDRLFIVKMVPNGLDAAGIYNIGYTVGSLVLIFVNAFSNFYTPYLMERLADINEERKLQIVKMGYIYLVACIGVLLGILVLSPILFNYFIDRKYHDGLYYVFWVALGYCFWGGYMFFSGFVFYFKRNRILAWLSIFNVVTNILFNIYFIRIFGPLGAAYATALSFFLLFLLIAYITQKMAPMPWMSYRKIRSIKLS